MKCSENVLVDGCVDSGFNKAQWTKVLFSDESKFCISFGPRSQSLEEEWRGTQSKMLEVQCEVSTVCVGLGNHVIGWCWSTVLSTQHSRLYQDISRALHASFSRQALWRCFLHFPAGFAPAHTAKITKTWFNDHDKSWSEALRLCILSSYNCKERKGQRKATAGSASFRAVLAGSPPGPTLRERPWCPGDLKEALHGGPAGADMAADGPLRRTSPD
ncbi:unnamed protein product [Leuciscus chuanchicus]